MDILKRMLKIMLSDFFRSSIIETTALMNSMDSVTLRDLRMGLDTRQTHPMTLHQPHHYSFNLIILVMSQE